MSQPDEAPAPGKRWDEYCVDGSLWMAWRQVPADAPADASFAYVRGAWVVYTDAMQRRSREQSARWVRDTVCPECHRSGHPVLVDQFYKREAAGRE